jgi:hypothetical protein
VLGFNANGLMVGPSVVFAVMTGCFGNRMRWGNLVFALNIWGVGSLSQELKAMNDFGAGCMWGMVTVAMCFFGPHIGISHTFALISKANHAKWCGLAAGLHGIDYYKGSKFEDAEADDPP